MKNRRPTNLLIAFAVTAVVCFVLASVLDEGKGWNHPAQFVTNIAWITMLLSVLGFVVTGVALLARGLHDHGTAH